MHHKFDVKSFAKLDNPERRKKLPPEEVLKRFGIQKGNIVADIGCGIGYFTIPASNLVGLNGKVYAMDISDEMLNMVSERIRQSGVENIEIVQIRENDFLLADNSADFAVAFFVLHEANDLQRFLLEIHRILKPGGKLAIIEWDKREMNQGPPVSHRVSQEDVHLWLTQTGFVVRPIKVEEDFYGLLATKE
ncbi:class I SAM-dependent methyltransferase [Dendrosporobacter sp. 1207_IL3150]|uniref:class I SAM-dependent methyltransferase n=1 Tax=Dendrosporobacter sp. 1207_IL3150 TaxID=3084054 RepID=UPI002FD9CE56